ncbi:hemolysin family protein [Tundrisphaera lichenicola]|uniref:hemolysin family protein n=1 Tax=Tundrisphaera lichenicola TaxID=2029860 RepID=UPI003EB7F6FD
MAALNLAGAMGLGLALLSTQAVLVALGRALRTYSRSRLEEVCEAHGRPGRADVIAHDDESTERAAESLAVVVGLTFAALSALAARSMITWVAFEVVLLLAIGLAVLIHLAANVIGRVWAETLIDSLWPIAGLVRAAAIPLTSAAKLAEMLAYRLAGPDDAPPRPASVEVEFQPDPDDPEDVETDLPESTRSILEHVVALTRRDVSEIMTPASSMTVLPSSTSARQAANTFRDSGLSRIPMFGENRDDILGILFAKDLFPLMTESPDPDAIAPRKLVRPAYFIPETKNANDLMNELRAQRSQIAIVLDEYGGVAGLVTLEDLLEELVGPIDDEHDVPTPDDPVEPLGGSRYEVDAAVPLEDLNERLGLRLPTDGDFQTIGGYAFHALGRVPEPGESFRANGVEVTVVLVVDHSIRKIQLELVPA